MVDTLSVNQGGTNSSAATVGNRVAITDANGNIINSASINTTNLEVLNGILSILQGTSGDNDKFATLGWIEQHIRNGMWQLVGNQINPINAAYFLKVGDITTAFDTISTSVSSPILYLDPNLKIKAKKMLELAGQTFIVAQSSGVILAATGDNTPVQLPYNNELIDNLGEFNPVTGVFTAGDTGWYTFNWITASNTFSPVQLSAFYELITTIRTIPVVIDNAYFVSAAAIQKATVASTLVNMNFGDTATTSFRVSGGARTVNVDTNRWIIITRYPF